MEAKTYSQEAGFENELQTADSSVLCADVTKLNVTGTSLTVRVVFILANYFIMFIFHISKGLNLIL